jgi:hypothetical protein
MSALYAIEDSEACIVSIEDTLGTLIYTEWPVLLYDMGGGSYVSDPLPLELGDYELTESHLQVTSGSELLYDESLAAQTNLVEVRDGYVSYDLLVEKAGYKPWMATFTLEELKAFLTSPLTITLNDSP